MKNLRNSEREETKFDFVDRSFEAIFYSRNETTKQGKSLRKT